MNPSRLLLLDRFFFLPYVLLRFLYHFKSAQPSGGGPVFIIKFMGMGSITHFAMRCRETGVDKDQLIFISLESNREVCSLLGFTSPWMVRRSAIGINLVDFFRMIIKSWRIKPGYIIDFERCSNCAGIFSLLLGWFSCARIVRFENTRQDHSYGRLSIHSIQGKTLPGLFQTGITNLPVCFNDPTVSIAGIDQKKILINCNTSSYLLARRYPPEGFVHLVEGLYQRFPELEFIFTGTTDEHAYVEKIVGPLVLKKIHAFNKAGQWSLSRFAEELSDCRLFITGDSGPLHLAALLGVQTFVIWGPTQAEQFGYESLQHLHSCSLRKTCSPCLVHPTSPATRACNGKIPCINQLSPDLIVEQVARLLNDSAQMRQVFSLPGLAVNNKRTSLNPV